MIIVCLKGEFLRGSSSCCYKKQRLPCTKNKTYEVSILRDFIQSENICNEKVILSIMLSFYIQKYWTVNSRLYQEYNQHTYDTCFSQSWPLHKIRKFHLISWCGNFTEMHSFRMVSAESSETLWKLCIFT